MKANVVYQKDVPLRDLGGGVTRRVLAYTPQLMIVEVNFVKSGRFRFTIDDEPVEVGPGDTIAFPSGIRHGTLCLEAGTLIDMFTPMREDFL